MNFLEKAFLAVVVTIFSYFAVYPHLEPHIEKLQDRLDDWREAREEAELRKLDREIEQLESQEPLIAAKLATQTRQDRINEKKRKLKTPRKSLISKIKEEMDNE